MKKNYIARRRGTSLAAAALSFALVAPFAQPVALPTTAAGAHAAEPGTFASQPNNGWLDENNSNLADGAEAFNPATNPDGWRHAYWRQGGKLGETQPILQPDGSYNVDPLSTRDGQTEPQITSATQFSSAQGRGYSVVSGRAVIVDPRAGGQLSTTYTGYEGAPADIPVYFQWIDNDGAVSPVYSSKTYNDVPGVAGTGGNGIYAFAVPNWVDGEGKTHRLVGRADQRYRIWMEPGINAATGNQLVPLRTAGGVAPRSFDTAAGSGTGEFPGAVGTNANMQRTGVWMFERPYAPATDGSPGENYMKAQGKEAQIKVDADGVKVEVPQDARLIEDTLGPINTPGAHYDRNFRRTVSGSVWYETGNERQLITGGTPVNNAPTVGYKVFASVLTDEAAAEYNTVVRSLDPELRAKATKDFVEANPDRIAGTVWATVGTDGEYTLRFPDEVFKDTNTYEGRQFQDQLYMWVEDPDGNVMPMMSSYTQPQFNRPGFNNQWTPTAVPGLNKAGLVNEDPWFRVYNVNFAMATSSDVTLDITNYNTTDKPAKRGDVAEVKLTDGTLPPGATLEWRDGNGNVVAGKSCKITSTRALGDCATFEVPEDAQNGSFYYAVLTNGGKGDKGQDIAADSFRVLVEGPQWDEVYAKPSKDDEPTNTTAVPVPNIGEKDRRGNGVNLPEPDTETFQVFDKDGDDVSNLVDVTLDRPSGNLTFTPKDGLDTTEGAEYTVKVTGDFITNPDEVKAGEPAIIETREIDDAKVIYRGVNAQYQPAYPEYTYRIPSSGSWAAAQTNVQFSDAEGNPVETKAMKPHLKNAGDSFEITEILKNGVPDTSWTDVTKASSVNSVDKQGEISVDATKTSIPTYYVRDDNRGRIQFIPPADAQPRDVYDVKLNVTYADGSVDEVVQKILIAGTVADEYDVNYDKVTVVPGGAPQELKPEFKTWEGTSVDNLPDGTTFAIDETKYPGGKVPAGYTVSIDPATGVITAQAEDGVAEPKQFEVPVTVTYPDSTTGTKIPGGTDETTATVLLDTDGDGIPDIYDVTVEPQEQTVVEHKDIEPITVTPGNDQAKVEFVDLPAGLKRSDENPNVIVGTPVIDDWGETEEVRGLQFDVMVTNPDGSTVIETILVTVQRDTDKDGDPDITDPDDDNDGIPDTEDKNPKTPDAASQVEPKYDTPKAGETTSGEPTFVKQDNQDQPANKPEGTKFTLGPNAPDGASVDPVTGVITVPGPITDDVVVPVVVTYKDGTTDTAEVTFTPTGQNKYTPTYPDTKLAPKEDGTWAPITVKPTYTDGKTPQGEKYAVDPKFKAPEGYTVTIDEKTGEITVVVDPSKLNQDTVEEFTVPVVVTYQDGTQDEAKAKFELDSDDDGIPDSKDDDDDNDGIKDTDEEKAGTNPKDPNSAPTTITPIGNQTGTVGKEIAPVKVEVKDIPTDGEIVVSGLPEGLTFDQITGEITGTPKTPTGDTPAKVTVAVIGKNGEPVKGKDGNDVKTTFEFTVNPKPTPAPTTGQTTPATPTSEQPAPTSAQPAPTSEQTPAPTTGQSTPAPTETPAKDPKVVPGENNEVPNNNEPTTVGKVENPTGGETGKLVDKDGEEIPGSKVEIDKETGEIKVTVPKGTDPQDATVVITGKDKDGKDQEIGKIDVKITGPTVQGENSNVPNDNKPHTVGKVENPRGDEQGKLIGKDGEEIKGSKVEIDKETGEIKVTVPEGTNPQEAKVVVTDGEGNKIGEVPANVIDKDSDAAKYEPKYGDPKDIKVGETEETVNPFGDVKDVPVKEVNVTVPGTATNWTVEVVTEPSASGVLKVTAPTTEQVAEEFKKFFPENPKTWAEVVEKLTPFAKPEIDVEFVYNDDSKDAAKAGFNLVDKDGKSILDPTGDIDGDGKTNEQEIKDGTDPTKVEDGAEDTTAPTVNPIKDTDKEISGKGDREGEKIVVTFPDGKTVETITDNNGNWTMKVPEGTDLKPGQNVTVEDGDGNKTEVTVTDGTAPTINPVKDTDKVVSGTGEPGEKVTVTFPGEDGKVVEVVVTVGEDGKWSVNVPEGTTLKPGDKITVTDAAGNKSEITVEKGEKSGTGLTEDERNKCIATSVGFGLPLLALIPLGLATQIAIPGLTPVVEQAAAQIQAANSRIQQQLGIFNPGMASQVAQIDAQLRQFGLDVATVGAGIVLIAAGIFAGTIIYDNCTPGGGSSNATLKDAELKGSSGRTYLKVDKEEREMKN